MSGFRENLSPYEGLRLKCRGIYEGQGTGGVYGRPPIRTALFIEIKLELPDGGELCIEHAWVQNAGPILDEKPVRGEEIEFTAIVNKYWKREPGCEAWGLTSAADVVTERNRVSNYRPAFLPPPPVKTKAEVENTVRETPAKVEPEGPSREPVTPKEAIKAIKGILDGFSDNGGGIQVATLQWVIENHHNIHYTVGLVGGIEEFMDLAEMLL